jgi:hypothetical protein
MSNPSDLHEQQLDDQLSEFTDRVLSGENEEIMAQDELVELQKAVLLMRSAAQKARASSEADAHIRGHLMTEWKKVRQAERQKSKGFNWNWNMPRLALAGGFAVLILISVVSLLSPAETPLTATANGSQSWTPAIVILGIVIIVFIFWRNRHD